MKENSEFDHGGTIGGHKTCLRPAEVPNPPCPLVSLQNLCCKAWPYRTCYESDSQVFQGEARHHRIDDLEARIRPGMSVSL